MKNVMSSKRSQDSLTPFDFEEFENEEDELLASLNIDESKKQCLKAIQKSTYSGKKNFHKGFVCIVCDHFIIGKEKVCWAKMKTLLENEERLSVERYNKTFECVLPENLENNT